MFFIRSSLSLSIKNATFHLFAFFVKRQQKIHISLTAATLFTVLLVLIQKL
jgi:hypothetical protein